MQSKQWPAWSEHFIKSGFPASSLLAGTEPAVWDALGRLELKDFDNSKQVLVRKALDDIGLGWVATNTTPFRIAIGGLFDAARKYHQERDQNASSGKSKSIPSIKLTTRKLPEAKDTITGPITKRSTTKANRQALWQQLETYGAYVIRHAVAESKLKTKPEAKQAKQTKLTRSMGNGVAGEPASAYMNLSKPPDWHDSLEQKLAQLLIDPGTPEKLEDSSARLKRMSILLLAGEGAENWAHQDNNDESPPLQAVLMLSEPNKDFTGGEFYVARQTRNTEKKINILRYRIAFESPGDLVIFQAGKDSGWWHGMLPVKRGKSQKQEDEYLRKAVGMLQPPAQATAKRN